MCVDVCCVFVCLFGWLAACLLACLLAWLLACLLACLLVCLFVCLFVCVFFFFFVAVVVVLWRRLLSEECDRHCAVGVVVVVVGRGCWEGKQPQQSANAAGQLRRHHSQHTLATCLGTSKKISKARLVHFCPCAETVKHSILHVPCHTEGKDRRYMPDGVGLRTGHAEVRIHPACRCQTKHPSKTESG